MLLLIFYFEFFTQNKDLFDNVLAYILEEKNRRRNMFSMSSSRHHDIVSLVVKHERFF